MANISQQIPNFLGGVSQASDVQKSSNQVDEIINGYPDATYGLLKRPGSQWLYNLDIENPEDYYWFTVNSFSLPYIGCIGDNSIRLWSTIDGTEQTIDTSFAGTYLDSVTSPFPVEPFQQFRVFTLEKGTIILNNRTVVTRSAETTADITVVSVTTYAELPETPDGSVVYLIENTPIDADNYYVQWNGEAYIEVLKPNSQFKLNANTLPHGLLQVTPGNWVVAPLTYSDRTVGNDKTNPFPSFVGLTINSVFAYMNRIGFLAGSNVIMSQPLIPVNDSPGQIQAINFFGESAFTVSEADPIDINAASIRDIVLFSTQPGRQGIILFAANEQFLLYSTDQVISPSTAMIRSLSTWEINKHHPPVELDSEFFFVSGQAPLNEHARLIKMVIRGMEEDPICTDVSKPVSEWIPSQVFQLESSTQEQFISILESHSNIIYFYRYFKQDGELLMKSWFKWRLDTATSIIFHAIVNGNIYLVTKSPDNTVSVSFLQLTTGVSEQILNNSINNPSQFLDIKPNIDLYSQVVSATLKNKKTQITMPEGYPKITDGFPILLLAENDLPRSLQYQNIEAGFGTPLIWNAEDQLYETTANIDITDKVNKMVVGFLYRFEVDLPTLFYRQDSQTDYSARLNIARCKFQCSAGLQGALSFELKSDGYTDFTSTYEVTLADSYDADVIPLVRTRVFEVPINKLNRYYTLKAISDSAFPLAMNSMTWEGNYSPRFYRRL